jgi:hypothetical protein
MIIPGEPYLQKILTEDEINQFLSQLENLGFYSLETNRQHDQTDQIYNFGDQYSRVFDGLNYCVLVNGDTVRNLCAYNPYREFLVPEMVNILNYLDNYQPNGMTQYFPERILLGVQAGRSPDVSGLPEVAVPWPESLPSLETPDWKTMYFEGDAAREVFDLLDATWPFSVFTQNELEYTVLCEIVLPHEEITQP